MVKENLKPLPNPPYPSVKNMDKESAKIIISNFFNEWDKVIEENQKRNKRGIKFVILCGLRKGFLISCGQKNVECASFCPKKYWEINSEKI